MELMMKHLFKTSLIAVLSAGTSIVNLDVVT